MELVIQGWRKFVYAILCLILYYLLACRFGNPDTAPYFELAMAIGVIYLSYGATNVLIKFLDAYKNIKTTKVENENENG